MKKSLIKVLLLGFATIALTAFADESSTASLSLDQALAADLGLVCRVGDKYYAMDKEDASFCEELGGLVQATARRGLIHLRNSGDFQRAAQSRERSAYSKTPSQSPEGAPYRNVDPTRSR